MFYFKVAECQLVRDIFILNQIKTCPRYFYFKVAECQLLEMFYFKVAECQLVRDIFILNQIKTCSRYFYFKVAECQLLVEIVLFGCYTSMVSLMQIVLRQWCSPTYYHVQSQNLHVHHSLCSETSRGSISLHCNRTFQRL